MRLWSIHPKYIDSKGLVALWREALLAKHVLEGKTKGYKNHPQLIRFINSYNSSIFINKFLENIYLEAKARGYKFNDQKFEKVNLERKLTVTSGQVEFERNHLLSKLQLRDKQKYEELKNINNFEVNPILEIVAGDKEKWEKA